ncbi:hypothetical protein HWI79_1618 [Cryptosporidium felis]|nr:hypothetical protein HWI79_1618 [Cryptosporidium felis]
MSAENKGSWFVTKVGDFLAKKNTKINNLANVNSEQSIQDGFFALPESIDNYTLFMCYKLYSLFDPENKGYITLQSVDEWAKTQSSSFSQDSSPEVDAKTWDKYKGRILRVCNSIETFKNRYQTLMGNEEARVEIDCREVLITIGEFVHFFSPLFDSIEEMKNNSKKQRSKNPPVHFATLIESNISLTNYFGTMTNTEQTGNFIASTISPSPYLEPKSKTISKGGSKPISNDILYITDSNLYHSSFWSPCRLPESASMHAMFSELDKIQMK